MTRGEAVNWIINIMADIGKAEHRELWHYEQALSEIREMFESEPERTSPCADCQEFDCYGCDVRGGKNRNELRYIQNYGQGKHNSEMYAVRNSTYPVESVIPGIRERHVSKLYD